jgi:hypothetical protein
MSTANVALLMGIVDIAATLNLLWLGKDFK